MPASSAGASFQAGIASGKFHGQISTTVPRGRRTTRTWPPAASSYSAPAGRSANPAAKRRIRAVRATSPRASVIGLPTSAAISCANSSPSASIARAAASSAAARASAGRAPQSGAASRARSSAATAIAASASSTSNAI